MAKYEKWLGASLGWILTGNPLGGILGFLAGSVLETDDNNKKNNTGTNGVTEFESNLIVLASHLFRVEGYASNTQVAFIESFFNAHFDPRFGVQRSNMLQHCLEKEYDLNVACGQIRMYATHGTRVQVVRFLLDVAQCDREMTQRENYFIFRIAGYINVNDVEFKRIKNEHIYEEPSAYDILGVTREMSFAEIRTAYRKMVLKYHPDRNKDVSEAEKKKLSQKFQQVQEAYEKIKAEKEAQ
jgi:DnaJ like chaperone protein